MIFDYTLYWMPHNTDHNRVWGYTWLKNTGKSLSEMYEETAMVFYGYVGEELEFLSTTYKNIHHVRADKMGQGMIPMNRPHVTRLWPSMNKQIEEALVFHRLAHGA